MSSERLINECRNRPKQFHFDYVSFLKLACAGLGREVALRLRSGHQKKSTEPI